MTTIEKIASVLGITLSAEVIVNDEKLSAEAITADGTKLYTENDTFDIGAAVQVVAEDGSMTPAIAGEVTLEDGSILVLDDAGIVVEVKPAAPAAEEPAGSEDAATGTTQGMSSFTLSEEEFNGLVSRIEKLEEVLLSAVEALSNTNKNLTEKVEKLSAQPAAEPVKPKYNVPAVEDNALARLRNKK